MVINGNPKQRSFSQLLAESYVESASADHDVRIHHLANMQFNPDLQQGYGTSDQQIADQSVATLEADLVAFQQAIQWAEHLVIVKPIWWGAIPAKLKGLFDRTFLTGFAFN